MNAQEAVTTPKKRSLDDETRDDELSAKKMRAAGGTEDALEEEDFFGENMFCIDDDFVKEPATGATEKEEAPKTCQARPSIQHKIDVLEAVYSKRGKNAGIPAFVVKDMAPSHQTCCGKLTREKIKGWEAQRKSQKWDDLPLEVRAVEFRLPNDIRTKHGMPKIGAPVALEDRDPEVARQLQAVRDKADSRTQKGLPPGFEDLCDTLKGRLAAVNDGREKKRHEAQNRINRLQAMLQAAQSEEEKTTLRAQIQEIENAMPELVPLTGSRGWCVDKIEKLGLEKVATAKRGETLMRPRDDPEVLASEAAEATEKNSLKIHQCLQCNHDEVPAPFWRNPRHVYASQEARVKLQGKPEGNINVEAPAHHKEYFTIGTTTTPFSKGVLLFLFKDNAPGGQKMAEELNKQYGSKCYVLRQGTGYVNKEIFYLHSLKKVILPTLHRLRKDLKIYKHERCDGAYGSTIMLHLDNAGGTEDGRGHDDRCERVYRIPSVFTNLTRTCLNPSHVKSPQKM